MDPKLILAKTMKLVRQKEAVQQHDTLLQDSLDSKSAMDLSPIDKKHSLAMKRACSVHLDGREGIRLPGKSTPEPCVWCVRTSHPIGI